ncbi:MAG: gamma-glutamyltransferase [Betaproteobacteria bacterium]|nr:gamma-glutamyltransferase [Betaproteobacteria bacterium]
MRCPFSRVLGGVIALTALIASGTVSAQAIPEAATGRVKREPVVAKRHMVVAAHPLAAEAGFAVLERGGSAIDAAIATLIVLNVVEPQSSGIGGGGFLLHYSARDKKLRVFDGRETAPKEATANLFLDNEGKPLRFFSAVVGGRAVGAPGLVPMLEMAHRALQGKHAWQSLFAPAIELADNGFSVSPRLNALITRDSFLRADPGARALFFTDTGQPLPVGARLQNRALAATLRAVAAEGAQALRAGPIARDIVSTVRNHPTNPGRLSTADLEGYRPLERAPLCAPYRVWRICGMPPPSAGGVTVLQILKLLEDRNIAALQPESLMAAHLFSEAGRLGYADRNAYLADPAFVTVPVDPLLSPAYLVQRSALIDPRRSMGRAQAGQLANLERKRVDTEEVPSTTHLSVVDGEGNAVALSASIENAFGARLMARGFLLNNQLTDFSFVPEEAGARVANRVEGGKRPRSSMAPTMVFDREGRLVLMLGSPGGAWIINFVARALVATLDWGLDLQAAFDLPHYGSRNNATELEQGTSAVRLREGLEQLGHTVQIIDMPSGLHGIQRHAEGWLGAADPRREGVPRGR